MNEESPQLKELRLAQSKIRAQRKELRALGRSHQMLWLSFRQLILDKDRAVNSWLAAGREISKLHRDIRAIRGIGFFQYWRERLGKE